MKKLSKRIICIALSFVCIFMSSYTVYANTDTDVEGDWEHLSNGHVIVDGIEYEPRDHDQALRELHCLYEKMGAVGNFTLKLTDLVNSIRIISGSKYVIRGADDTIYFRVDRKTEDDDSIKFNSDYVNDVHDGLADIIRTEDGYFYIPTTNKLVPDSYFSDDTQVYCFNTFFKDWLKNVSEDNYIIMDSDWVEGTFFATSGKGYTLPYSVDPYVKNQNSSSDTGMFSVKYGNGTTINYVPPCQRKYYNDSSYGYDSYYNDERSLYYNNSMFHSNGNKTRLSYVYSSTCKPLKIWNSSDALLKYYRSNGTQNFYTSNTFNNYNVNNDNSITVNKNVYNNTDYETINNNNYTTINNTVNKYYEDNNTVIDTSSIEDIIKKFQDDQAKRDNELLDKVEDNNNKTEDGNQIGKDTNEKLDKIYAILQRIADKIGESGDSGTSDSDFDMNTLIEMLNNLQLSLDTMWQVDIKDIQNKLGTIVDDLKSDNPDSKSILEDIYKTQQQILELHQASYDQNKTFFDTATDYLKKILHALTLGDSLDIIDKLLDIKDDAESLTDFVDGLVGDFEPTVQLMKTKFPTSIPWDIIAVISVMSCEPQTPYFEIPIHVNMFGQEYDYTLAIDLEQFDRVAVFGRALLTIMFTLWLLLITKQLLYKGE